jgi:hypothetical protein
MKTFWGSGGIAPRILDLGTRWRWVVSFTHRPLYLQGKIPWYPLDRRLGGPQSRSGRGGEEKNSQPPPGIEPYNPDRPARSSALYRLSYHGSALKYENESLLLPFTLSGTYFNLHGSLPRSPLVLPSSFWSSKWPFLKCFLLPRILYAFLDSSVRDTCLSYCNHDLISLPKGKVSVLWTPRYEGITGQWRYSSTRSWPRH